MGRQECWEEGRELEYPGRAGEKSRGLSAPEAGSRKVGESWGLRVELERGLGYEGRGQWLSLVSWREGVWGTWGGFSGSQFPKEGNRVAKGDRVERKKGGRWGGTECRTHTRPCTPLPRGCRGAVLARTARGRCASGRGARTRPPRREARSARGRRSAAPRHPGAALPGPRGLLPPGGAGLPHAPAGSRWALQGQELR